MQGWVEQGLKLVDGGIQAQPSAPEILVSFLPILANDISNDGRLIAQVTGSASVTYDRLSSGNYRIRTVAVDYLVDGGIYLGCSTTAVIEIDYSGGTIFQTEPNPFSGPSTGVTGSLAIAPFVEIGSSARVTAGVRWFCADAFVQDNDPVHFESSFRQYNEALTVLPQGARQEVVFFTIPG